MNKKIAIASLVSSLVACTSQAIASANALTGNADLSIGITSAQIQTTTFSGNSVSTSNGATVVGSAVGAEYLFAINSRFSIGPSFLTWSLPSSGSVPATSGTAYGGAFNYAISDKGSVRLVLGNELRLGYNQQLAASKEGAYFTFEAVAPNKNQVDSFSYIGVGYRF